MRSEEIEKEKLNIRKSEEKIFDEGTQDPINSLPVPALTSPVRTIPTQQQTQQSISSTPRPVIEKTHDHDVRWRILAIKTYIFC